MANSYLFFSSVLTRLTPEEETWITDAVSEIDDSVTEEQLGATLDASPWRSQDNDYRCDFECAFDTETDGSRTAWFYTEEYGDPDAVCRLVQAFLKKFRPNDVWSLRWCVTCDKPRVDHFYGGATIVTANEIRDQLGSERWIENQGSYFKKYGRLPPEIDHKPKGRFKTMAEADLLGETGWNDATMVTLLRQFVEGSGLTEEFTDYLRGLAHAEDAQEEV